MPGIVRGLAGLVLAALALGAAVQGYPTKPVRIVNPFAPGGATDQLARFQRAEMEKWAKIVKDSGAKVD